MTSPAHPADPSGLVDPARAHSATGYDFRRPIQLSREHTRLLQLTFEAYAKQCSTVFTSSLRVICTITPADISQVSYAEYIASLPDTTHLSLFSIDPLGGTGVLQLPLTVTMLCLDHMLGGSAQGPQPRRPLTELEAGVVHTLLERLLADFGYALSDIAEATPRLLATEYSPQFAQAASGADVMIVTAFDLEIGNIRERMTMCLPFAALAPHLDAALQPAATTRGDHEEHARAAARLTLGLDTIPVPVSVRLRPASLDSPDLMDLRPGDVIHLPHPETAPLEVVVDDVVFAHAEPGVIGTNLAALILETTQP